VAKPKAPAWLRESFRDGVDENYSELLVADGEICASRRFCYLAHHDDRPCEGRLERFHYIPRQRVEHALGALLPLQFVAGLGAYEPDYVVVRRDLILLAAWDPRNGGIACEAHHRRFDGHLTPAFLPIPVPKIMDGSRPAVPTVGE